MGLQERDRRKAQVLFFSSLLEKSSDKQLPSALQTFLE